MRLDGRITGGTIGINNDVQQVACFEINYCCGEFDGELDVGLTGDIDWIEANRAITFGRDGPFVQARGANKTNAFLPGDWSTVVEEAGGRVVRPVQKHDERRLLLHIRSGRDVGCGCGCAFHAHGPGSVLTQIFPVSTFDGVVWHRDGNGRDGNFQAASAARVVGSDFEWIKTRSWERGILIDD